MTGDLGWLDDAGYLYITRAFRNLVDFSSDGSIHFVCMDWRHAEELLAAARSDRL
jgi:hypothetical protein